MAMRISEIKIGSNSTASRALGISGRYSVSAYKPDALALLTFEKRIGDEASLRTPYHQKALPQGDWAATLLPTSFREPAWPAVDTSDIAGLKFSIGYRIQEIAPFESAELFEIGVKLFKFVIPDSDLIGGSEPNIYTSYISHPAIQPFWTELAFSAASQLQFDFRNGLRQRTVRTQDGYDTPLIGVPLVYARGVSGYWTNYDFRSMNDAAPEIDNEMFDCTFGFGLTDDIDFSAALKRAGLLPG